MPTRYTLTQIRFFTTVYMGQCSTKLFRFVVVIVQPINYFSRVILSIVYSFILDLFI